MSFFVFASGVIGKLVVSLAGRSLGDRIKEIKTQRRMTRMVEDAVDRIVDQVEGYLRGENVSERGKEVLIASLCAKLQPLADDPQQFFAGNLDGALIFTQCHPKGELPQEIREERLDQFYTVLFPQIAHFLAGSRIALAEWQADGFREEFKRLTQLAEEIRAMNAKVAELPGAVAGALSGRLGQEAEIILREFAQTVLSNLLVRLDISPLRAERSLHGSLSEHFVVPAVRQRLKQPELIQDERSIIDVLAAPNARRIVHGAAGVGKTTCSLWLQSRLLQAAPGRLAVVFRLRQVTDLEKHSLLDLLRESAGAHLRDALTDEVLRLWHATGRLVVILDGFDEVPEVRRDALEKWVKDLHLVAKKTVILVTSRPLQSGHLGTLKEPWQQWDLLPFDEPRIIEFIDRWHRYLPEGELALEERSVDASTLARTFFSDPSLRPLADTPLMLGTLLFVHHRDKKLPSGRVDLYERYIAAMLGLRDSGLGIQARATKLTDKEKRRVLGHIALHFHLNSVNEVNDDTMRQLVTEAMTAFKFEEDVDRLLPALCERTGLLQGPGAWSFMHKTIGEFLVAELVCDGGMRLADGRRLDRKELWAHRHEDSWTAVLFFWAGKTTPRELEEFIEELLRERITDSSLLALSLLHDQGDRLTHETQRDLALKLISNAIILQARPHTTAVCFSPTVPRFAYAEYSAETKDLRGLTRTYDTDALAKMFSTGVLTAAGLNVCHPSFQKILIVSAVWALGRKDTKLTVSSLRDSRELPVRDLALFVFYFDFQDLRNSDNATVEVAQRALARWLETFAEGRRWVPLLLIGVALDEFGWTCQSIIGPMLWEWRDKPLAERWLSSSDECAVSGKTGRSVDLLLAARQSFTNDGPSTWGITLDQHADLVAWCDRMIEQRSALKRASQES